jgi:hypothetical protein
MRLCPLAWASDLIQHIRMRHFPECVKDVPRDVPASAGADPTGQSAGFCAPQLIYSMKGVVSVCLVAPGKCVVSLAIGKQLPYKAVPHVSVLQAVSEPDVLLMSPILCSNDDICFRSMDISLRV